MGKAIPCRLRRAFFARSRRRHAPSRATARPCLTAGRLFRNAATSPLPDGAPLSDGANGFSETPRHRPCPTAGRLFRNAATITPARRRERLFRSHCNHRRPGGADDALESAEYALSPPGALRKEDGAETSFSAGTIVIVPCADALRPLAGQTARAICEKTAGTCGGCDRGAFPSMRWRRAKPPSRRGRVRVITGDENRADQMRLPRRGRVCAAGRRALAARTAPASPICREDQRFHPRRLPGPRRTHAPCAAAFLTKATWPCARRPRSSGPVC